MRLVLLARAAQLTDAQCLVVPQGQVGRKVAHEMAFTLAHPQQHRPPVGVSGRRRGLPALQDGHHGFGVEQFQILLDAFAGGFGWPRLARSGVKQYLQVLQPGRIFGAKKSQQARVHHGLQRRTGIQGAGGREVDLKLRPERRQRSGQEDRRIGAQRNFCRLCWGHLAGRCPGRRGSGPALAGFSDVSSEQGRGGGASGNYVRQQNGLLAPVTAFA